MNGQWMAVSCVWCVRASVVQCMQSVSRVPVCQRCWPPVRCCDSGGWRLVHWGRGTQMMSWLVPVISSTRPRTALSHLGVSRCHTGKLHNTLVLQWQHVPQPHSDRLQVWSPSDLSGTVGHLPCWHLLLSVQNVTPVVSSGREEETVQPSHIDGDFCYSAWHGPS